MRVSPTSRLQLRLINASFVVLFLVAIGLAMWLSREYHLRLDWTHDGRNTASEASLALLQRLDGPLTVTAFASERQDLRKEIREVAARYQRHKPDLKLEFVNPDTDPTRAREAGIQYDGELVLEHGARREPVRGRSDEQVANALARLARGGERLLVFLGGHGERSPERGANHDLSTWAAQLQKRGIRTYTLTLSEARTIPQNTAALIIAAPQTRLLPGEVGAIKDYLAHGGNLLWLHDPGPAMGLEPVAEMLGLEFQPGVIVDPASRAITGGPATFTVVAKYGVHPLVRGLASLTLFPLAGGIQATPPKDWQAASVLDTLSSAWSETGQLRQDIRFDRGADIAGPLTLGVALTRQHEQREQRVVVVGDGDFLSNTYVGNGGNLDLGMNLASWVALDEANINVPARTAPDTALNLSQTAQIVIAAGFLALLPLGLFGGGIAVWLRRRRL